MNSHRDAELIYIRDVLIELDKRQNLKLIAKHARLAMALNDDLSLTLASKLVAETRSKIDCPINDPDAILQIMFSGRHINVISKIIKHSSLCYLMGGIDLQYFS